MAADRADLVDVGAGMVGGWASYFARLQGAERVIVWGPAVATIAADLALEGRTSVASATSAWIDSTTRGAAGSRPTRSRFPFQSRFRDAGRTLAKGGNR